MENNLKLKEKGKDVKNKPLIKFFTHISDLNVDSKKQISSFDNEENNSYLKNINIFNIRNENINGVDISNHEEENQFLNSEYIKESNTNNNNNPFNVNKEPAKDINENEEIRKKKINNNRKNITQQQNKKILQNQKKKKQARKNKKKKRNTTRSYSTINNKSNINSKRNKSSQYSDRSGNSTKRTNYILRTHDTPEKYPDDYLTVDSSSDEEKDVKKKEFRFNSRSSLYKDILENSNIENEDCDPRKRIEKELEGFDLMTADIKKLYKNKKFKKKYFKSFKAEIKVVNFDEKIVPLHAIFIFNESNLYNYNIIKQEKKLFPGAYSKEEFVNIFTNVIKNKNSIKVELLMDYVDISRYQDYTWIGINPFSLNDFYILVEIIE
jgi:hypothetical protein